MDETRPPFPERCPNCNNKKDFRYLDNEVQCSVCGKMLKDLEGEKITKPLERGGLNLQGSLSGLLGDDIPPAGAFPISKEVLKKEFNLADAEALLVEKIPLWVLARVHGLPDDEVREVFYLELEEGLLDDDGHYRTGIPEESEERQRLRESYASRPMLLIEENLTKIVPSVRFSHPVKAYIEKGHKEKLKRFNVSAPLLSTQKKARNPFYSIGDWPDPGEVSRQDTVLCPECGQDHIMLGKSFMIPDSNPASMGGCLRDRRCYCVDCKVFFYELHPEIRGISCCDPDFYRNIEKTNTHLAGKMLWRGIKVDVMRNEAFIRPGAWDDEKLKALYALYDKMPIVWYQVCASTGERCKDITREPEEWERILYSDLK